MPKFVWQMNARGRWAPQPFHGEMPREMSAPHNAHMYVIHDISADLLSAAYAGARFADASVLTQLAEAYPAPAPEPREIVTRIQTELHDVA